MTNPILDELHAIRRQMLADAGGTLSGLVAKIQADQAKSDRVILKTADNQQLHWNGTCATSGIENQTSKPSDV